jgi:hypothetical protein
MVMLKGWARAPILGALLGLACASTPPSEPQFHFFSAALPDDDPWFEKVEEWQRRARADAATGSAAIRDTGITRSSLLRNKIGEFEASEKRKLARRINQWAQIQARKHYRSEPNADFDADHWPTFGELIERNGDDCDGLDLIGYQLLREFGYERDTVYRAIVRRDRDRANHMVTLWFEDADDPWVLDATGAMTMKMRRISELPGWTPTKMFNEFDQYRVVLQDGPSLRLARDPSVAPAASP